MTAKELERARRAEEQLNDDLRDYADQWVAIKDHQVVEHAPTLLELRQRVKPSEIDRVQRVPAHPGVACYF